MARSPLRECLCLGAPDGLKGVVGGLVAVHGFAFGSQLAQPPLVEGVVQ